MWDLFLSLKVV